MANSVSQLLYTLDGDAMGKPRIGVNFPDDAPVYTSAVALFNNEYTITVDKPAGVNVTFTQQITYDSTIGASTTWVTVGSAITGSGDTVASYNITRAAAATRFLVNYTSGTGLVKLWLSQEVGTENRTVSAGGTGEPTDGNKGDITVADAGLTWGINDGAVTNTKLANISSGNLLARTSVGSGSPESVSLSSFLDTLGSAQGAIIQRGASSWDDLPPGLLGEILQSLGASANLVYRAPAVRLVDCMGGNGFMSTTNEDAAQTYIAGTDTHSFLTQLSTGETATGNVARHTALDAIRISSTSGTFVMEWRGFQIPTLSTSGERHQVRLGFLTSFASTTPTNSVCFDYDATVSTSIRGLTSSSGSSGTSSLFVPVAGTNYDLRMEVTATSAKFYHRLSSGSPAWTLGATRTTTIPTALGQEMYAGINLIKITGTTPRTVQYQSQILEQWVA